MSIECCIYSTYIGESLDMAGVLAELHGSVAQLGERGTEDAEVAGSSPA